MKDSSLFLVFFDLIRGVMARLPAAQARGAVFVGEATGSIAGLKEIAEEYNVSQTT